MLSIDDPLRDLASTYTLMSRMAPCIFPCRSDEFIYRSEVALDYYQSRFRLDESRFDYWRFFKCLMLMIAFEHGVEVYGRFSLIDSFIQLFTELTGVEIYKK
jgi:hypothetical protein